MSARHRQHKRKLEAAQKDLADRKADLASYERVIADMVRRELSPFGGAQAIAIVRVCRDVTARECEYLAGVVTDLEKATPR
jgi:hypothetical protein